MYYQENNFPIFNPANWYLYKMMIYIFVFGIMFMCCAVNFRRAVKDCLKALKKRKVPTIDD